MKYFGLASVLAMLGLALLSVAYMFRYEPSPASRHFLMTDKGGTARLSYALRSVPSPRGDGSLSCQPLYRGLGRLGGLLCLTQNFLGL
jgi:hypothetical protein